MLSQKIRISNTKVLKPGKTVCPVGFQTGYKTYIKKDVEKIDQILRRYNNGDLAGKFKMLTEDSCEVIKLIYKKIEIESDNCIDKDAFISLINYLSSGEVNIYCGIDRNISRLRKTSRYYSDMPYNGDNDLR